MRKTILHWLSILAGIYFFIISLQGVQEHAATYALNNDNLTALFHIEQADEQGLAHLLRINWARIPSLLPDYGVAAVANHLGSTLNQKFVLSCLLQSCLGIVSVYLLLRSVMPKRNIDWTLIPLLSYGGLLMASSGSPSARKVDAPPFRLVQPPGGLMEPNDASLQRGRQG